MWRIQTAKNSWGLARFTFQTNACTLPQLSFSVSATKIRSGARYFAKSVKTTGTRAGGKRGRRSKQSASHANNHKTADHYAMMAKREGYLARSCAEPSTFPLVFSMLVVFARTNYPDVRLSGLCSSCKRLTRSTSCSGTGTE
jgi:hypothetical protein